MLSASLRKDLNSAGCLILAPLWLLCIPLWIGLFHDNLPPKFSVQLTDATSLDTAPAPPAAPMISTAFNITLHAINRRREGRCYRHGEAVVLYSGLSVAWGRTPRFCVDARDARDVTVVAWADGVELPKLLGERMAAERRAGSVELEVDVRLFRGDDGTDRPTWMRCKVIMGGALEPPDATPCTMFALQNWASDIAPYWMQ